MSIEKSDIDKVGYDQEELYFEKLNEEARRKLRERLKRERDALPKKEQPKPDDSEGIERGAA